jgi:acyl-coenzyme A synthetase/AMP-(fatty) acid ligase
MKSIRNMQPAQVSSSTLRTLAFPELVDYHLAHNPDSTYAIFPGKNVGDEPSHISLLEFGRAAQRFARAVYPGAPVNHGAVVAFIANCDTLMYMSAIVGLIRAGFTVSSFFLVRRVYRGLMIGQAFPISHSNSPATISSMLRKISSHRLIATTASLGSLLEDVKNELAASDYALEIQELPAFPDIYPHFTHETVQDPFEPIALPSRDTYINGIVLYLHTSGTTGFPKIIPWTHEVFSKYTFAPYCDEYRSIDSGFREFFLLYLLKILFQRP